MSAGKMASQSSHAAVQTSLECLNKDPERFAKYQDGAFGTKVCLSATEHQLLRLFQTAKDRGLPCALIEDSGHAAFNNGEPTVTALGVGPIQRHEMKELRRLPLLP